MQLDQQHKPSKATLADVGALLRQHGPLSLRGLCANGRHHEADVVDALEELRRLGLAVELSGGLYRFDATAAAQRIGNALSAEAEAIQARMKADQQRSQQVAAEQHFPRIRVERMA